MIKVRCTTELENGVFKGTGCFGLEMGMGRPMISREFAISTMGCGQSFLIKLGETEREVLALLAPGSAGHVMTGPTVRRAQSN